MRAAHLEEDAVLQDAQVGVAEPRTHHGVAVRRRRRALLLQNVRSAQTCVNVRTEVEPHSLETDPHSPELAPTRGFRSPEVDPGFLWGDPGLRLPRGRNGSPEVDPGSLVFDQCKFWVPGQRGLPVKSRV